MAEGATAVTQKSGYLDVKQPATIKGRKLKTWRRRWVVVTKMADLTSGSPTAKLDLLAHPPATTPQGQGRAVDRLTFVLERVTNVRPCRSRTRPFAFEVIQDTAVLVLSGSSEMESTAWTEALCNIFFADRRSSLATDRYSVTVHPSPDSQRLELSGTLTLCVGPEAVSLMTPSLAETAHPGGTACLGTWALSMLRRFRVEREPLTGLPRLFLLHCGPNSPCGEAIFYFLSDEAHSILASVRKVISVAMATRGQQAQTSDPGVRTGAEPQTTVTDPKARGQAIPTLHDTGTGPSSSPNVKVSQGSLRSRSGSGSRSGSSLCSATPRSSLSEPAPDSGGESPAEESMLIARGRGVSVSSTTGSVSGSTRPLPTLVRSGQVLGQSWQAEKDHTLQQPHPHPHPFQQQAHGQCQQQQQHEKRHNPQRSSLQPKEIWTAPEEALVSEKRLFQHQEHREQPQQQQQRHEHFQENWQHARQQAEDHHPQRHPHPPQDLQKRGSQHPSQEIRRPRPRPTYQHQNHQQVVLQPGALQYPVQDVNTSSHLVWQQQQQQQQNQHQQDHQHQQQQQQNQHQQQQHHHHQQQRSDPWSTSSPQVRGSDQYGLSLEPQWPLHWLGSSSEGQSEGITQPDNPDLLQDHGGSLVPPARPLPDWESQGEADAGVEVLSEQRPGISPGRDSRCSATPRSSLSEPAPDSGGESPAEESMLIARGRGVSVSSTTGSVSGSTRPLPTLVRSGQVLGQSWQAEKDHTLQQPHPHPHPFQQQAHGQCQQQQQHEKRHNPQRSSLQPKEIWTAPEEALVSEKRLFQHQEHREQPQQQQQRHEHFQENWQHARQQAEDHHPQRHPHPPQDLQKRGSQHPSQEIRRPRPRPTYQHQNHQQVVLQPGALQYPVQDVNTSSHLVWQQQQQQQQNQHQQDHQHQQQQQQNQHQQQQHHHHQQQRSDPWSTSSPQVRGSDQYGLSLEPQWPLHWLGSSSEGQSEGITQPDNPDLLQDHGGSLVPPARPLPDWESQGEADAGVEVLSEQRPGISPGRDSRCSASSVESAGSSAPSLKVSEIHTVQEDQLSISIATSHSTPEPSVMNENCLTVVNTPLSDITAPQANETASFPHVTDHPAEHLTPSCTSSTHAETDGPANERHRGHRETRLPAIPVRAREEETDRPVNEIKVCQCEDSCTCPVDHVAESGCDNSKQHVYQSVESIEDDENMETGQLCTYSQGFTKRSLSTGDVARDHHYEELDASRMRRGTGMGIASRTRTMPSVVDKPPDLPARPLSILLTCLKSQNSGNIAPATEFTTVRRLNASISDGGRGEIVSRMSQSMPLESTDTSQLLATSTDHYSIISDADCIRTPEGISSNAALPSSHFHLPNGNGTTPLKMSGSFRATRDLNSPEVLDSWEGFQKSLDLVVTAGSAGGSGSSEVQESPESSNSSRALMDFFLDDAGFHQNPMVTGELASARLLQSQTSSAHSDSSSWRSSDELSLPPVREDHAGWACFEDHAEELGSGPRGDAWPGSDLTSGSTLTSMAGFLSSACVLNGRGGGGGGGAGREEGVYVDMKGQSGDLQEDSDYVSPSELTPESDLLDLGVLGKE